MTPFRREAVRIVVPASSANLGPGFDCFGLALVIYHTVQISCEGEDLPGDPFIAGAGAAFFKRAGLPVRPFSCRVAGDVPRSRGVGSSVTVRLGVLHGLNLLHGSPLDAEALFSICHQLEGHPDNAAASAFGGFVVCLPDLAPCDV